MPILPFGEYRPDVSDYDGQTTKNVLNVFPRGDGYGPVPGLTSYTSAAPAANRGFFFGRKNDGTVSVFMGTSTKLYQLNNTTLTWTDVSKSGGTYSALASTANWQFAQFNNFIFATQVNAPLQKFDLTSDTTFSDAAGSPPQAAYIAVVNRFLVLSGIASPNVYRVQWSGLNDVTSSAAWTSGTNSSDFQDLADGGIVRGISGGEQGVILQDASIRRMTYAPGSPVIFEIDRISIDDGIYAPYSIVRAGDRVFWCSPQGFKYMLPGGFPTPIGKEKVDRTFFADVDTGNLQLVIGAVDPTQTRVYWGYKSINGAAGSFDKILCYDWVLDRWTPIKLSGQYLASLAQPGLTLEGVDAAYGETGTTTNITSVTISAASGDTFNLVSHGLSGGQGILLGNSSTLPSGYTAGTPYYVKAATLTSSSFQVSASGGVGPLEGSAVTSTSSGSGTNTFQIPSMDVMTISFDSISNAAQSRLAGFDATNKLGFFSGSNLEATMETPEQGGDGTRFFVRAARVVSDAPTINVSVSARESPQATATYSAETSIDATGQAPQRVSTRYARGKIRIPSGTVWTFAAGVEPEISKEGLR